VLGLTPEQQTMVRASADSRSESRNPFKQWLSMPATPTVWAAGLVAASLLVAVAVAPSFLRSRQAAPFATLKTQPDITAPVLENPQENSRQQPQPGVAGGAVTSAREASVNSQAFDSAKDQKKEIPENKLDLFVAERRAAILAPLDRQQGQTGQQAQQGQQGQADKQLQQGFAKETDRRRNEGGQGGGGGVLKAQE